jgi:hypothetical protein
MIMKKIHKINAGFLFFSITMALILVMSACKKNIEKNPVITGVVNYVASPNDTALHSLVADGQWVVITGQNLQNTIQIKFNGVTAPFNATLFSQNSAVVQIPPIMFSTIDSSKLYTIEYTTKTGATTFSFKLGPAVPVITAISDVFANPGDSVFLYGTDLVLVESLFYAGNAIAKTVSNLNGTALGFLMPAQTPTDQVLLITKGGRDTFKIVATPTITGVSNENAITGDSVYVYGTNLKNIQTISFAGQAITSFTSSKDGKSVGIVMPLNATSGPASITTKYGTATTVYNMHDLVNGLLGDLESNSSTDKFGMISWYGGTQSTGTAANAQSWLPYNPDFPGNPSNFAVLKTNVLQPGDGYGGGWPPTYQIAFDQEQWIPQANLSDSIQNYALKFEISIPQTWNGSAINIEVNDNKTFIYRWEPWQITGTKVAYTTKGWITLTVPFTEFRKTDATLGDGRGVAMTKFSDILDSSGNGKCYIFVHNYGSSATATGFYGAFDNLRVVKIK